eukprot:1344130-Amorphochlora_amoeboformis.AAC.1
MSQLAHRGKAFAGGFGIMPRFQGTFTIGGRFVHREGSGSYVSGCMYTYTEIRMHIYTYI